MPIANRNVVHGAAVATHAPSAIFLRDNDNRYRTRTKTFANIPFVEELLYLALDFLCLLGVDAVRGRFGSGAPGMRSISLRELDDVTSLEDKLGRSLTREEKNRIGVSNLRLFLEELLQNRYSCILFAEPEARAYSFSSFFVSVDSYKLI